MRHPACRIYPHDLTSFGVSDRTGVSTTTRSDTKCSSSASMKPGIEDGQYRTGCVWSPPEGINRCGLPETNATYYSTDCSTDCLILFLSHPIGEQSGRHMGSASNPVELCDSNQSNRFLSPCPGPCSQHRLQRGQASRVDAHTHVFRAFCPMPRKLILLLIGGMQYSRK